MPWPRGISSLAAPGGLESWGFLCPWGLHGSQPNPGKGHPLCALDWGLGLKWSMADMNPLHTSFLPIYSSIHLPTHPLPCPPTTLPPTHPAPPQHPNYPGAVPDTGPVSMNSADKSLLSWTDISCPGLKQLHGAEHDQSIILLLSSLRSLNKFVTTCDLIIEHF